MSKTQNRMIVMVVALILGLVASATQAAETPWLEIGATAGGYVPTDGRKFYGGYVQADALYWTQMGEFSQRTATNYAIGPRIQGDRGRWSKDDESDTWSREAVGLELGFHKYWDGGDYGEGNLIVKPFALYQWDKTRDDGFLFGGSAELDWWLRATDMLGVSAEGSIFGSGDDAVNCFQLPIKWEHAFNRTWKSKAAIGYFAEQLGEEKVDGFSFELGAKLRDTWTVSAIDKITLDGEDNLVVLQVAYWFSSKRVTKK